MHDKIIFLLPLGDIIYLFMILIMFWYVVVWENRPTNAFHNDVICDVAADIRVVKK